MGQWENLVCRYHSGSGIARSAQVLRNSPRAMPLSGYELVRPELTCKEESAFLCFHVTIDVCKRKGRGRSAARQDITAETPVNFGTNEHPYKAAKILIIY